VKALSGVFPGKGKTPFLCASQALFTTKVFPIIDIFLKFFYNLTYLKEYAAKAQTAAAFTGLAFLPDAAF